MFGGFGRGRKPEPSGVLDELLSEMLSSGSSGRQSDRVANTPEQLRAAYAVFAEQHTFKPGDLVMWKEGQKNRATPAYGEPIIVAEIKADPVIDTGHSSGNGYFNEPLDMLAGEVMDNGDGDICFVLFHYDSRRFQPYTEE